MCVCMCVVVFVRDRGGCNGCMTIADVVQGVCERENAVAEV